MKITVSTEAQTIKIHGSFKYEDFKKLYDELPEAWKKYEISLAPMEDFYVYPHHNSFQIPYALNPIRKPFEITCSTNCGCDGRICAKVRV